MFTANESASIALAGAFVVTLCIRRDCPWRGLPRRLHRSVKTVSVVVVLTGFAAGFGQQMTPMQIAFKATAVITGIPDHPHEILMHITVMRLPRAARGTCARWS